MKQRITIEELNALSKEQQINLRNLWIPQPADIAVAIICTDAEEDHYEQQKFVIESVNVVQHPHGYCSVYLSSLLRSENVDRDFKELLSLLENNEEIEEISVEENYDKEDCLPLLNIGQLIEILKRQKYGEEYFNISLSPESSSISRNSYSADYEEPELCDVLWETVKQLL